METVDGRSAASAAIRIDNPAESERVFQEAFRAGDLDGLVSIFEPDAVFVPAPGDVAAGSTAIREVAASFLAMKVRLKFTNGSIQRAGDMALKTYEWKLEGDDAHGNPVTLSGRAELCFAGRRTDPGVSPSIIRTPSNNWPEVHRAVPALRTRTAAYAPRICPSPAAPTSTVSLRSSGWFPTPSLSSP